MIYIETLLSYSPTNSFLFSCFFLSADQSDNASESDIHADEVRKLWRWFRISSQTGNGPLNIFIVWTR